jgi:hypothetical protein
VKAAMISLPAETTRWSPSKGDGDRGFNPINKKLLGPVPVTTTPPSAENTRCQLEYLWSKTL